MLQIVLVQDQALLGNVVLLFSIIYLEEIGRDTSPCVDLSFCNSFC